MVRRACTFRPNAFVRSFLPRTGLSKTRTTCNAVYRRRKTHSSPRRTIRWEDYGSEPGSVLSHPPSTTRRSSAYLWSERIRYAGGLLFARDSDARLCLAICQIRRHSGACHARRSNAYSGAPPLLELAWAGRVARLEHGCGMIGGRSLSSSRNRSKEACITNIPLRRRAQARDHRDKGKGANKDDAMIAQDKHFGS